MSDATLFYLYVGLSSAMAIIAATFFIVGLRQLFLGLSGKPNIQGQEQRIPWYAQPSGRAGIIYLLISLALGLMTISQFLDFFNKDLLLDGVILIFIALIVVGFALFIALKSRSFKDRLEQPRVRIAIGASILFSVFAILLGLVVVFISNALITVVMIIITLASFVLCVLFSYRALRANRVE